MSGKITFLRLLCVSLLAGLATACTTASLEELRSAKPSEDPFQSALAAEYLAFSESEARQYDWWSSKIFADKGLAATYGRPTGPESPAEWDIDETFLPELDNARNQLLAALTPETITAQPALAARTQFFYDCWVEQQNEAWQDDDISSCREGFYRSIRALSGAPQEPEAAPLIFSSSYILFFEWNKWDLTKDGKQVVDSAAQDLKSSGETEYEVILNGHADRSGNVEYNLKLSQKRAETVKAALIAHGIPENRIRYFAFGESDNRVPTADNVRERANRRVEIFFNQ